MDLAIRIDSVDGSQMAAKITGTFGAGGRRFGFEAIAFGRIGGQNVGATLSEEVRGGLLGMGHDPDAVVLELQAALLKGDLTLPEGLTRESFADG